MALICDMALPYVSYKLGAGFMASRRSVGEYWHEKKSVSFWMEGTRTNFIAIRDGDEIPPLHCVVTNQRVSRGIKYQVHDTFACTDNSLFVIYSDL